MIYLHLYHGRTDPAASLEDWGSEGPTFATQGIHVTYTAHIALREPANGELWFYEDMLYYDGVYYGDWTLWEEGEPIWQNGQSFTPSQENRMRIEPFSSAKATDPRQPLRVQQ
jgi:hypothetical protein